MKKLIFIFLYLIFSFAFAIGDLTEEQIQHLKEFNEKATLDLNRESREMINGLIKATVFLDKEIYEVGDIAEITVRFELDKAKNRFYKRYMITDVKNNPINSYIFQNLREIRMGKQPAYINNPKPYDINSHFEFFEIISSDGDLQIDNYTNVVDYKLKVKVLKKVVSLSRYKLKPGFNISIKIREFSTIEKFGKYNYYRKKTSSKQRKGSVSVGFKLKDNSFIFRFDKNNSSIRDNTERSIYDIYNNNDHFNQYHYTPDRDELYIYTFNYGVNDDGTNDFYYLPIETGIDFEENNKVAFRLYHSSANKYFEPWLDPQNPNGPGNMDGISDISEIHGGTFSVKTHPDGFKYYLWEGDDEYTPLYETTGIYCFAGLIS